MSGLWLLAYVVMPIVVVAMGYGLFRYDAWERRHGGGRPE